MRRFAQFFLVSWFLVLPTLAQRSIRAGAGGGFHNEFAGRGVPRWRAGSLPSNRFVGFGFSENDWTGSSSESDYPGNDYFNYPAYSCPDCDCGLSSSCPVVPQSPPKVTEYRGPGMICPQANGKPLYRIAIASGRGRTTYQNNIWVAQNYSYSDGTLNFMTIEGDQKKLPTNSVNPALTLQLNRECGVNFRSSR